MKRLEKHFYEFGEFRIDTRENLLVRAGQPVALPPKLFDLLLLLVENNGHTLGKGELMERVWPGTFVEENSLIRNISLLRKLLGDGRHDVRFIKTVPKRGYRFESEVRKVFEEERSLVIERRNRYSLSLRGKWFTPTRTIAATVIVLLLIATLGWWQQSGVSGSEDRAGAREAANAEAVDLYQRGRKLWQNRSAAGLHEATMLLEQAVERDPNFVLAYSALADAYAFDTGKWQKVEETASRALVHDPDSGEAYASVGFVRLFWEWNPGEAQALFRKSLALSPDYSTAHQWYAVFLTLDGQFNEALFEIDRAIELDPGSLAAGADRCQILYFLQRYDDAEKQCRKVLDVDPAFFAARLHLYDVYTASGKFHEAVDQFFKAEELAVNHSTVPEHLAPLRDAYDKGGITAFWRARLEFIDKPKGTGGYAAAKYYARLGDKDHALQALRQGYDRRDFEFPFFLADPVFMKCCLGDPRYRELRSLWQKPEGVK